MQRGQTAVIVIFGLIFLIVLGGSMFYLGRLTSAPKNTNSVITSSSSPSATIALSDKYNDWMTYTNGDYGISFKYPPEFTIKKEEKAQFEVTDFDGNKVPLTQYFLTFTTGQIIHSEVGPYEDFSYIGINIKPTNGKTITEGYDNKKGVGGEMTKVTLLNNYGGVDEVAEVSNIPLPNKVYRKGNYFITFGHGQDRNVLPDRSDDIALYMEDILRTLNVSNFSN